MNISTKARKTTLAAIAGLMVITAGATVAPTQAQAGNNVGAFALGAFLGVVASQPRYNTYNPGYVTPGYNCRVVLETRYDAYYRPYTAQVQYC